MNTVNVCNCEKLQTHFECAVSIIHKAYPYIQVFIFYFLCMHAPLWWERWLDANWYAILKRKIIINISIKPKQESLIDVGGTSSKQKDPGLRLLKQTRIKELCAKYTHRSDSKQQQNWLLQEERQSALNILPPKITTYPFCSNNLHHHLSHCLREASAPKRRTMEWKSLSWK